MKGREYGYASLHAAKLSCSMSHVGEARIIEYASPEGTRYNWLTPEEVFDGNGVVVVRFENGRFEDAD